MAVLRPTGSSVPATIRIGSSARIRDLVFGEPQVVESLDHQIVILVGDGLPHSGVAPEQPDLLSVAGLPFRPGRGEATPAMNGALNLPAGSRELVGASASVPVRAPAGAR